MVNLPGHELDDVDVVRAEAYEKGEKDEEDDGAGPVVPPESTGDGVLPGRSPQLQVDLHVAADDDGERAAEGDGAGQQQEIRGEPGAFEVEVLHAGSSFLVLAQHAAEQQGSDL